MVEEKLICPLADIFSPRFVASMKSEAVTLIAGECTENRMEREQLKLQLDILSRGLNTCKHFIGVGGLGKFIQLDLILLDNPDIFMVPNTPVHQPNILHRSTDQEVNEMPSGKFRHTDRRNSTRPS